MLESVKLTTESGNESSFSHDDSEDQEVASARFPDYLASSLVSARFVPAKVLASFAELFLR